MRMVELNDKSLIDSLATALIVVDQDLTIKRMNTAAEMLLAVSSTQVQGTALTGYVKEPASSFNELRTAAEKTCSYIKRGAGWQLINGSEIMVDYSVTSFFEDGYLLIEVQPLDRLFKIRRDETNLSLQEAARSLVRSMAHEIKNPLGGIRGAAQLLARELSTSHLTEYTQIMIDEVDRLRRLVDKMLGPNEPLKFQSINVHEVLERVVSITQAESGGHVEILRDYDPSIPAFQGDCESLIQAFLNVMRNALEALEDLPPGLPKKIKINTRITRQCTIGKQCFPLVVRVDITDNGPGIPEPLLRQIFYPMISGRAQGSGLGLAITHQLIVQHQGMIECKSEAGHTQFSFFVPLHQPDTQTSRGEKNRSDKPRSEKPEPQMNEQKPSVSAGSDHG